ncbi:fructose-1,6-bisphosphate aldolase/phosphatase [Thermoanaerobacter siderophilus]|uniref:Fructose-1,6-bisphosphate aldolase/phosphatase n=1 Tax=Thermoanaerobacter siderophilus SR4 TaxID=880478 RepID=I9ABF2_9THEO|nr:fructose-1,6-bisphosphate aldolase/phosphatase [Thermoanaerobacter siderophilus]EIV99326.1 archaeal fructose 1,6-bisphosphatase [Thermoanaerobacter siderophilus SR4]
MSKITLTVIKADVGGFVGHTDVHPELLEIAKKHLKEKGKMLIDFHVTRVGDDIELIMTHRKGIDNEEVHKLAWDALWSCGEKAKELKLYGAGQDLLKDSFSGNIKGLGPGVAEMEIEERKSEPVIIFMADKTEPGAWNLPLYKMFADPFNTVGLVIDPNMHQGFKFEVYDMIGHKKIIFETPEDIYDMLVFIGATGRYCIRRVYTKNNEIAAVSSTQRMNFMAGKYIGKDDPVLIVRCQNGLPAVGEALEPFANPYLVAGWMRGSHNGPMIPVSLEDAVLTRFDGPPRVCALGFQLAEGKLIGPQDFFKDVAFDNAREKALEIADYIRKMGPFEPHRLPLEELEYTTLPHVAEKLQGRWEE